MEVGIFLFLKTPEDIIKKMNAYGHGELTFKTDKQKIENSIKSKNFYKPKNELGGIYRQNLPIY